ncbi:MAG: hypothetical protein CL424_07030 [Acidimicrobiaceae bacterium]|nr:hypothetical protein [Acidimicrobiaceae bacterium]
MAYIVQRNNQFYVVAYNGVDPHTGKERRRWHPAGRSRDDAEAIAARLGADRDIAQARAIGSVTVEAFLIDDWLPRRRRELRPSTARRYEWYVANYIAPAIGQHRLNNLRAEHLDRLYRDLLDHGGTGHRPLSAKTVYDVHLVIRSSFRDATRRHLVDHNVALETRPPRVRTRSRHSPEIWTATQLADFLAHTAHLRLYPALHLTATTGMRRGEVVGLRWGDWIRSEHRLSIARSRQSIQGGTIEVPTKTAASRRSIELDPTTEQILAQWRRRLQRDGHTTGINDPMFINPAGNALNPESLTQLFNRKVASSGLPRIRFHDLRHTHASLLIAIGVPIKVVSERLGHAHPGFTMATYQHLLPGMGAAAATHFQDMLATARDERDHQQNHRRVTVIGRHSTGPDARHPRSQHRDNPTR